MASVDDSMPARISPDCPQDTRDVLHHAWAHDVSGLKKLLDVRERASAQDPQTGETPLHAAIRACGPASDAESDDEGDDLSAQEAKEALQELFFSGAIWNDVDCNNETPGCVAWRLGRNSLYRLCVDAGVRAELLFALMGGYEELSSGSEAGDDGAGDDAAELDGTVERHGETGGCEARFIPPDAGEKPITSDEYLKSDLTYDADKLLDSDLNGVMMAWETDIMRRSVAALVPGSQPGKRVLNIGFGMGIIDRIFADLQPSRHHIIEAHPSVLEHVSKPESRFGPAWEKNAPQPGAYQIFSGRWQEVVPRLIEQGETYDAIYFDTFGEDYSLLKMFFTEYIPALLDQDGRFSFFNGLGADRRICYDVYTKVVEMHCADAGLDVEWEESDVDMAGLGEEGKGQWEGVRRRYWTLDKYRLPTCTFMG
ncbi:protein arginine N-methyltransferase 2 [Hirsutella rhossiliensis]|uniref:Arginine N-methyltransferase 2 n=1 Tax=Hirsutella rhossiliensis TaxID=111463 RepID=A0A9P8MWC1_9HYPO|nr:protein arginine N-methyltransferase 2 [Hirsutella rhossiliensis]KAH0963458.1 protein arginine N-methyltransferase 2 [Hirsutella rhossiliensis]